MTGDDAAAAWVQDPVQPPSMGKVAVASFVGTAIEFYDFYIYGTASALVLGDIFFPELSPISRTLASLSTFAVAFIARPLGSVIFGHFGDRVGRKSMLIVSLLLMGLSTLAVGMLPGYQTLGLAAPIILVLLRLLQGIGLGGEWGGAALIATEHAPAGRRALYGMFPQLGPAVGYLCGSAVFLVLGAVLADAAFQSWGWRVPFLVSAVLILTGLYVRLQISETPAFRRLLAQQRQSRVPFGELFARHTPQVLLGAGAMTICYALFYTATTYSLAYGTKTLGMSNTVLLLGTMVGVVFMAVGTGVTSVLADRFGRRPVLAVSCLLALAWGFAVFPLFDTTSVPLVWLALAGLLGLMGATFGPMGAYLPELFSTRTRYSGAALAYSLGGVLGGALAPLLATKLQTSFGSWSVGAYLSALAVVSLVCVLALPETRQQQFD